MTKFICWVAGHKSRSVGYSINAGPDKNQKFDLQQCQRCIKCWRTPIKSIFESAYACKC